MPDWWEIANGTDPYVDDAAADPDGDGMTNLQEYWAGTSPTNAASALRLFATSANGRVLSFQAMSNHAYNLQTRAGFQAPWTSLLTVAPSPTNRWISVTNLTASDSGRYYRVQTSLR
jgi:hypothetical protein